MEGLINIDGERKYLNQEEREAFYKIAKTSEKDKKYFALLLYYTGARLNEILSLTIKQIDLSNQDIIIQSLKKRGRTHFRAVPVPEAFIEELAGAYDLRRLMKNRQKNANQLLFSFVDRTAKRYIKQMMTQAGIQGPMASAKGLRHSYGVKAVEEEIPVTVLQDLLGHSFLKNTSIYTKVQGKEKRNVVSKMWG